MFFNRLLNFINQRIIWYYRYVVMLTANNLFMAVQRFIFFNSEWETVKVETRSTISRESSITCCSDWYDHKRSIKTKIPIIDGDTFVMLRKVKMTCLAATNIFWKCRFSRFCSLVVAISYLTGDYIDDTKSHRIVYDVAITGSKLRVKLKNCDRKRMCLDHFSAPLLA